MFNDAFTSILEAVSRAAGWAPAWLVGVALLLLAAGAALLLTRWCLRRLFRLAGRFNPFPQVLPVP